MTRLQTNDICHISKGLGIYNQELLMKTGRTLLGVACHAYGREEIKIRQQLEAFSIHVVPVTAGEGIITEFSETVSAILGFLGFNSRVSAASDTSGIAQAFVSNADAIMMSDDNTFVGLNLNNRSVADNSEATGRVFAAALDLMAKGLKDKAVLVQGCGPVGESAARTLLSFGARVALYDIDAQVALCLKNKLAACPGGHKTVVETHLNSALASNGYLVEATPSADTIKDGLISDHLLVAAPGVPLGVSEKGCQVLGNRLLHDKLELGVAAMAICLMGG